MDDSRASNGLTLIPGCLRHRRTGPVTGRRRRPCQRQGDHTFSHLGAQRRNARPPRLIPPKARGSFVAETFLPPSFRPRQSRPSGGGPAPEVAGASPTTGTSEKKCAALAAVGRRTVRKDRHEGRVGLVEWRKRVLKRQVVSGQLPL